MQLSCYNNIYKQQALYGLLSTRCRAVSSAPIKKAASLLLHRPRPSGKVQREPETLRPHPETDGRCWPGSTVRGQSRLACSALWLRMWSRAFQKSCSAVENQKENQ